MKNFKTKLFTSQFNTYNNDSTAELKFNWASMTTNKGSIKYLLEDDPENITNYTNYLSDNLIDSTLELDVENSKSTLTNAKFPIVSGGKKLHFSGTSDFIVSLPKRFNLNRPTGVVFVGELKLNLDETRTKFPQREIQMILELFAAVTTLGMLSDLTNNYYFYYLHRGMICKINVPLNTPTREIFKIVKIWIRTELHRFNSFISLPSISEEKDDAKSDDEDTKYSSSANSNNLINDITSHNVNGCAKSNSITKTNLKEKVGDVDSLGDALDFSEDDFDTIFINLNYDRDQQYKKCRSPSKLTSSKLNLIQT